MVKLATAKKPAAAKEAPKLAKSGKAKAAPKAKAEKVPVFNEGQTVEFVAYASPQESPMFEAGDRLIIVGKDKDEDQKTFYTVIKEADKEAYDADPESVDGDQVYGNEIKKAEKLPVDPYAIDVVHIPQIDAILEENDGDPLKAANSLQEAVVQNTLFLGGMIGELYKGQKFREYGDYADTVVDGKTVAQSGWDRFCQDNLGMGGRKAFGLITIYNKFAGLADKADLDLEAIFSNKKIGWVKLEYMASVVDENNAKELLEAAEELNVTDFKSTIQTDYKQVDGGTRTAGVKVKRTTVTLRFFEDQGEGVQYVLEAAQKQLGMDNLENTVEAILMQWASDHLSEAQVTKAGQAKRKKQTELKKAGVDISALKERDAKLETILSGGEGEGEG